MCECSAQSSNQIVNDDDKPETVTLFEKCPKPYSCKEDVNKLFSSQCLQTNSSDTTCCAKGSSTSFDGTSSSSSTRMYKFVTPRDRDHDEQEEEIPKAQCVSYEPCTITEEEEIEDVSDIECTLAIIKPEALIYRKQIERRIFEEGFEIYQTRWLQLTCEQVSEFYFDNYGKLNFAHLVAYMASGPIIVFILAKRNAVKDWRTIIGPTKVIQARLYFPDSIRGKYGRRGEDFKNAVHGSATLEEAEREIHFFFPQFTIKPMIQGDAAVDYLSEVINPILVKALSECHKVKPADPILWLGNWLILNNPNKPKLPEHLALIPT